MTTGSVGPYVMDAESEADQYLTDLFEQAENRSIDVVQQRAHSLNVTPEIKKYFLKKAQEMLKA